MSQATRPTSTKKKWPWVAGAAGGVILVAGAVNAGKSAVQADAGTAAPTVVTSAVTQLVPTTVISTSVVTSALTETRTAEPITVTVTAPAAAEPAAAEAPAVPAPAPLAALPPSTTPAETTTSREAAEAPSGGSAYYKNCAAVWAAGKAPIHAGDPGYSSDLDGDSDGIGCEKPPR